MFFYKRNDCFSRKLYVILEVLVANWRFYFSDCYYLYNDDFPECAIPDALVYCTFLYCECFLFLIFLKHFQAWGDEYLKSWKGNTASDLCGDTSKFTSKVEFNPF